VWGSTVADPEHPDRIIFDLDPGPGIGWRRIADAALAARDMVAAAGLTPFVKATGGKGLHVVVPVEPQLPFDEARAWARSVAEALVAEHPGRLTSKMAKDLRPNRIFIDYLRNSHGDTAIVPYSTRARPGAPVSVPLEWAELEADRDVRQLSTKAVLKRLETLDRDAWADLPGAAAPAPTATSASAGDAPSSAG
jgi:bifunctional non-homologous end joining protein LigD